MADQEQEHIEKFNDLILEHRVRPTALLPLWNIAGFTLGATTALMGKKAAMACTVAVEKVIGEHYRKQQSLLEDDRIQFRAFFNALATGTDREWMQQSSLDTWVLMEACNLSARRREKIDIREFKELLNGE